MTQEYRFVVEYLPAWGSEFHSKHYKTTSQNQVFWSLKMCISILIFLHKCTKCHDVELFQLLKGFHVSPFDLSIWPSSKHQRQPDFTRRKDEVQKYISNARLRKIWYFYIFISNVPNIWTTPGDLNLLYCREGSCPL